MKGISSTRLPDKSQCLVVLVNQKRTLPSLLVTESTAKALFRYLETKYSLVLLSLFLETFKKQEFEGQCVGVSKPNQQRFAENPVSLKLKEADFRRNNYKDRESLHTLGNHRRWSTGVVIKDNECC